MARHLPTEWWKSDGRDPRFSVETMDDGVTWRRCWLGPMKRQTHRYLLEVVWDRDKPRLQVIGLNPSKATAKVTDPTLTLLERRGRERGYGGLALCNLFAFRCTLPAGLRMTPEPEGAWNTPGFWLGVAPDADVLAMWGNDGDYKGQAALCEDTFRDAGRELLALGLTANRQPRHILRTPIGAPWDPLDTWRA